MSTDDIPGWALEAAKMLIARDVCTGCVPDDIARTIVANAPQPSSEVAEARKLANVWFSRLCELGCDFGKDRQWHNVAAEKAQAELAACQQERDQLADWKASALAVMNSWDCQAVGKLLGLTIGQAIHPQIEPRIRSLIDERDRLREAGNRLAEALEILKGNFEKGGCSRNADYRTLVEIIAHWRATTGD